MAKLHPIPTGTSVWPPKSPSWAGEHPEPARCHLTCLKLPFFLCSQSIMS